MFSKVRVTDVVPAPDEPVMAMMGCFCDTAMPLGSSVAEQAALGEQRGRPVAAGLPVVALDAFHLASRAEDDADALVQRRRLDAEHRCAPGARAPAGLLDDE